MKFQSSKSHDCQRNRRLPPERRIYPNPSSCKMVHASSPGCFTRALDHLQPVVAVCDRRTLDGFVNLRRPQTAATDHLCTPLQSNPCSFTTKNEANEGACFNRQA